MEEQRQAFEGTERIETAIAERILHNAQWLPAGLNVGKLGGRQLSIREVRTQQQDVKALTAQYENYCEAVSVKTQDQEWILDKLLEDVDNIEKTGDDGPASSLETVYSRQSHAQGLQRFLCPYTSRVDVDKLYSPAESYGQYVDLAEFHQLWTESVGETMSYQQYLKQFPELHSTRQSYALYISRLRTYLESAYERFRPFGNPLRDLPEYRESLRSPADDPLWCADCNKLFTSEGVFTAHFQGKKHKRAAAEKLVQDTSSKTSADVDAAVVRVLARILAKEINDTVANINRRLGMTQRERMLETESYERAITRENEYTSDGEPDSAGQKSALDSTQVYLGIDGKPIPHWLHKLQGLGVEFKCEICGGHIYKGRKEFERHFRDKRHREGLKCLNAIPEELYKGLSTIKEVTELRDSVSTHEPAQPDVEVEDGEGNVMSQRVYNDLKRQGIL